ncbi:MAG: glycoside hydrolase family 71 protein [Actinomycetota bacterium]|nr:glycoside hydrolase family 71 protein [Actinomycetota bacterium]
MRAVSHLTAHAGPDDADRTARGGRRGRGSALGRILRLSLRPSPRRRRVAEGPRSRLRRFLALAAVVGSLAVALPQQAESPAIPDDTRPSPGLAFAMPPRDELRSASRRVFAHYFPPLPISIDNERAATDYYTRNYLAREGEGGKHAAYGGFLRDRPLPRPPRPQRNWRLLDLRTEVRQAVAAGLDGFAVDILQFPGDPDERVWTTTKLLMQAANDVDPDFDVMLMPDMSGSLRDKDVETVADAVAELGASPSAYRLADGRLVVAPFFAHAHPVSWWQEFLEVMETRHRTRVAFVPLFLDEQVHARDFASISYGMANWGARNPKWNDPEATFPSSPLGRAQKVHSLGKLWMQPVSVQDARPAAGLFDESENTTNLRATWRIAIDSGAEWVQLTTWNDYSESTSFAPSVHHGRAFLDISAYYLAWYKLGTPPRILRDTVYLTHRTQFVSAQPRVPQDKRMQLRGGSPARDTIEALTFLRAPATVVITVGSRRASCEVHGGVDTCTVPLGVGTVSARVLREGREVATVESPFPVTATPEVQDLQYVAASSARPARQQILAAATVKRP